MAGRVGAGGAAAVVPGLVVVPFVPPLVGTTAEGLFVATAAVSAGAAPVASGAALSAVAVALDESPPPIMLETTPMAMPTTIALAPTMSAIFEPFMADASRSSRVLFDMMSARQLGAVIAPPPSAALPQT